MSYGSGKILTAHLFVKALGLPHNIDPSSVAPGTKLPRRCGRTFQLLLKARLHGLFLCDFCCSFKYNVCCKSKLAGDSNVIPFPLMCQCLLQYFFSSQIATKFHHVRNLCDVAVTNHIEITASLDLRFSSRPGAAKLHLCRSSSEGKQWEASEVNRFLTSACNEHHDHLNIKLPRVVAENNQCGRRITRLLLCKTAGLESISSLSHVKEAKVASTIRKIQRGC